MSAVRCARGELPLPDPAIHGVGSDDAGQRGPKQLALLEHFGLVPSSRVLEIGCGLGRLAYELASYLDAHGRYTGFDIAPDAITWLNDHYASRLPGFEFDLLKVGNPSFDISEGSPPHEVRFPYPNDAFDMACAFEVFMHLPVEGVRNYVHEIARVLRPGGTAVMTFMAIWEDEPEPTYGGRPFVAIGGGVHTRSPDKHGVAMGYRVELLRDLVHGAGLELVAEVEGRWHSPWKEPPPGPVHNCDLFAASRPLRPDGPAALG